MTESSRQCPSAGHPLRARLALPQRPGLAKLLALWVLLIGSSFLGRAQASAEQADRGTLSVEAASEEGPQWRSILHDAPPCEEVSAIEAEGREDPLAPGAPSLHGVGFPRCLARVTASVQEAKAAPATYISRFAASPVCARAPPRAR